MFWHKKIIAPKELLASVSWAVSSLKKDPKEWTLGEHYLTHTGGAKIWVANHEDNMAWTRELSFPDYVALKKGDHCEANENHLAIHEAFKAFKSGAETFSGRDAVEVAKYLLKIEGKDTPLP